VSFTTGKKEGSSVRKGAEECPLLKTIERQEKSKHPWKGPDLYGRTCGAGKGDVSRDPGVRAKKKNVRKTVKIVRKTRGRRTSRDRDNGTTAGAP